MSAASPDWEVLRTAELHRHHLPALRRIHRQGNFAKPASKLHVTSSILIPSSQAHKLLLAVTSSVFEGMFFGPLASDLREVRIDDVKPAGFRRLIHFIYNSRCLSWKIDDPEEWWFILEAANKYMNSRLVDQVRACTKDYGNLQHYILLYRLSGGCERSRSATQGKESSCATSPWRTGRPGGSVSWNWSKMGWWVVIQFDALSGC